MLTTSLERYSRAIKAQDVEAFRDRVKVGESVYVQLGRDDYDGISGEESAKRHKWIKTTVIFKAPFVAKTKHGTFRWADLCRWGREHKEKYGY